MRLHTIIWCALPAAHWHTAAAAAAVYIRDVRLGVRCASRVAFIWAIGSSAYTHARWFIYTRPHCGVCVCILLFNIQKPTFLIIARAPGDLCIAHLQQRRAHIFTSVTKLSLTHIPAAMSHTRFYIYLKITLRLFFIYIYCCWYRGGGGAKAFERNYIIFIYFFLLSRGILYIFQWNSWPKLFKGIFYQLHYFIKL